MNPFVHEITRRGAIQAVESWRRRGCEYASVIEGVPRPWEPRAIEHIALEAASRGVEVLSLSNAEHLAALVAAICRYIDRSLSASQAQAETRRVGAVLSPGGNA